jgi:lactose/cellobiose-specific phosphotransferase system IIC component
MASTFARVLPSRDEIDERCRTHRMRVTGMRRFWAVLFDYLCIDALYLFVTGAIRIINPEFTGLSMYAEVDSRSFFCAFSLVMVLVTRGSTLAVVLYMMLFAKSELLKSIGRIGILPGLFNINEPVTFGLPIVLNPVLMVPYILAPIAAMTVQYVGTAAGLFPLCNNMVPWTTPVLISGFLTTGSFMGVVAQLCGLAAAMAVWLPFIRAYDKKCYREEQGLAT